MNETESPIRRPLFRKYFLVLFVAVVLPLLASSASDALFSYRDQRAMLDLLLRSEARAAAARIAGFLAGIEDQLSWTVQRAWSAGSEDRHRLAALGVLSQVPAVISITLLDGEGIERLFLSRVSLNRDASGHDRSEDPAVLSARQAGVWYGPVSFRQDSEPFMTIALAGNRRANGVVLAEINLKLIQDVVSAIRIGDSGHAFVVDSPGRLIAHPDVSRVLRGSDELVTSAIDQLREQVKAAAGAAVSETTAAGEPVVVAMAPVPGVEWTVFVEQPLAEAYVAIYAALWRTGGLVLAGAALAAALAFWLARRMTGPIRLLEEGTEKIGSGAFDHRIELETGDELARLAERFNRMAEELALSEERKERIARLKRFLAPQVAELVEEAGDESVLAGQRSEVVTLFSDLRGFTAFAARAAPQEVMALLSDYHKALGAVVTRYEATLTGFSGDGAMVLVNAPVPCREPAFLAVEMALDMRSEIGSALRRWQREDRPIGFGLGLAMGAATVGRIGYENRLEYTAIGSVVNLASRLCALAREGEILIDSVLARAVKEQALLSPLGLCPIKGFERPLAVFALQDLKSAREAASS